MAEKFTFWHLNFEKNHSNLVNLVIAYSCCIEKIQSSLAGNYDQLKRN